MNVRTEGADLIIVLCTIPSFSILDSPFSIIQHDK